MTFQLLRFLAGVTMAERKRLSLAERRRQAFGAMELMRTGPVKPEVAALFQGVKPRRQASTKPRVKSQEATEHQEQSALCSWWHLYATTHGMDYRLLFAIPNAQLLMGHTKNPAAFMSYLRAEGFRKGAPDLLLAVPRGKYHGLFIELKRAASGVVSDEQKDMLRILSAAGYMCMVCYGAEDAKRVIVDYLNDKDASDGR